ncbi:MAG: hypothetical protein ACK42H_13455 [Planctomycetota bacterium]
MLKTLPRHTDNSKPSSAVKNLKEQCLGASVTANDAHWQPVHDMLGPDLSLQFIQKTLLPRPTVTVCCPPRTQEIKVAYFIRHSLKPPGVL